jgi:hypothetical protein
MIPLLAYRSEVELSGTISPGAPDEKDPSPNLSVVQEMVKVIGPKLTVEWVNVTVIWYGT